MSKFNNRSLEMGFVLPGTPTFADLIARLATQSNLSPTRQRDLRSGLRRVAKALARPPETIPADPKWLQPRLERIAPAALGLTSKTWSNALSDTRAALAHFGIVRSSSNHRRDLSDDWQRLWTILLASNDPTLKPALRRFVFFLNLHSIAPEDVADIHADAYRDALVLNVIGKAPETSYRAAVNGWNLAVRRLPDWPRRILALPSRQRRIQLPLDDFPTGFRNDLDRYLHGLEQPDPFSDEGRLVPLRPDSVKQYRLRLHRFASILVHSGLDIAAVDGLNALVEPGNVERGLRWMLKENDGKSSPGVVTTARLLKEIGQGYLHLPDAHQAILARFVKRIGLKEQQGMTRKNRERLRPLENQTTLRKFLSLPDRLFDQARDLGDTYRAHLLRETGVAMAILLHCPIRRKNLISIHLEHNLQRPGDGRTFMVFIPEEVKNERPIEFELPVSVVKLMDRHLESRSPRLCPPATPWLFPKRDGSKPIDATQLSGNVCRAIRREIGIDFNMHLFRHLAAKLWLDANPGQYEVVRRLLGHSELSRTLNAYAGFEAGTATRLFSEVVDTARMS